MSLLLPPTFCVHPSRSTNAAHFFSKTLLASFRARVKNCPLIVHLSEHSPARGVVSSPIFVSAHCNGVDRCLRALQALTLAPHIDETARASRSPLFSLWHAKPSRALSLSYACEGGARCVSSAIGESAGCYPSALSCWSYPWDGWCLRSVHE